MRRRLSLEDLEISSSEVGKKLLRGDGLDTCKTSVRSLAIIHYVPERSSYEVERTCSGGWCANFIDVAQFPRNCVF